MVSVNNDGTYFIRLDDNSVEYPKEIHPVEFHKISMFAHESDGDWSVTERRTGFRVGIMCKTMQDAINSAEFTITQHGVKSTKGSIRSALNMIKHGHRYDAEKKEWVMSDTL
jgi:hypothetical protein